VRIPELDLEVAPGSSSTGYVSNVEGVLVRFSDVLDIVERDLNASEVEAIAALEHLRAALAMAILGTPTMPLTLELLDPTGRSVILSDDATQRPLTEAELAHLPLGPEVPVFSA
jgi:zinc finger protein